MGGWMSSHKKKTIKIVPKLTEKSVNIHYIKLSKFEFFLSSHGMSSAAPDLVTVIPTQ